MDTRIEHDILGNTDEGSTAYICVLCGKGQSSLGDLEKHMLNHNENPQAFENEESLMYIQTENDDSASLKAKNYDKENINVYEGTCNIRKRDASKLETKILKETIKNNRNVGSCSSVRKNMVKENLKEKVKSHMGIHYCTICNKGFTEKRNLMYHYRTHQEEKQFKCEFCGKGFHFNFNLKKHIRIHTGETPYSCNICQRGFRHKNSLNRHMMIHLDSNHYGNNKRCNRKELAKKHCDNKYQCVICKQYFVNQQTLENHLVVQHKVEENSVIKILDRNAVNIKYESQTDGENCSNLMGNGIFQRPENKQECNIGENSKHRSSKTEKVNISGLDSSCVCGVCMKVFNKRRGLSMHVYRQYKHLESAFCKLCDSAINGSVVVHLMSHSFKTSDVLEGVHVSSQQKSSLSNYDEISNKYTKTKMTSRDVPPFVKRSSEVSNEHVQASVKHIDGKSKNSSDSTEKKLHEKQIRQDYKQVNEGVETALKERPLYLTSTNVLMMQTLKNVKREVDTDDRPSHRCGKGLKADIKNCSFNEESTLCQGVLHHRDATLASMEYKFCSSTNDICDPAQELMETQGQILGPETVQDNIKVEDSLHGGDTRSSIDSMLSSNPGTVKVFKCPVCDRSFRFNSYLKSHMKVHSGEKPHTCPVCSKGFTHKFNLTKHIRTHTGETPYMCKFCGRQFSQKNSLNRHKLLHTENSLYTCYLCGLKLCDKTTFEYHLLSHGQLGCIQNYGNKDFSDTSETLKFGNNTSTAPSQKLVQNDSVLIKNNKNQMFDNTVSDKNLLLNEYTGHQNKLGPKIVTSFIEFPNFSSDKKLQQNSTAPKIVKSPIEYPISAFDKQSFCKKSTTLDYDKFKLDPKGQKQLEPQKLLHTGEKDSGKVSGQSEPLNLSLKTQTSTDIQSSEPLDSEILNLFGIGSNLAERNQRGAFAQGVDVPKSKYTGKVMKRMQNMVYDGFTRKFFKKTFNFQRNVFGGRNKCNLSPCNIGQSSKCRQSNSCSQTSHYFKRQKKLRKISSSRNKHLKKKKSGYQLKSTKTKRVCLKCKGCFMTFNNRISLKYHNFNHLKEENFKCEQCKKTFRLFISLNIHMIAYHTT